MFLSYSHARLARPRDSAASRAVSRHLVVARGGEWFEVDGQRVELGGRRRLCVALGALVRVAERGSEPMTIDELVATIWPGERILPSAALNRLRVAMSTLRTLGLGNCIERGGLGYRIAPTVELEVV